MVTQLPQNAGKHRHPLAQQLPIPCQGLLEELHILVDVAVAPADLHSHGVPLKTHPVDLRMLRIIALGKAVESVLKPSHCVKNDDVIEWEHEET